MTLLFDYSVLLTVDADNMFDELFRYPCAPIGYYAMGVMFAIFYFEYQQSVSNRDLKNRRAYRVIKYINTSKQTTRNF